MIHPDHIEAVARRAYGYFRAKYLNEPMWADLPETLRSKWRDNVVDADKINPFARAKGSEVFQEQCLFDSIERYYNPPAEETQNVPIAESKPVPNNKPKRQTKRK